MSRLIVRPARGPLRGAFRLPSDKSISHRTLIFGAIARGRSVIRGFSGGGDNHSTLRAFRQLGVQIEGPSAETVIVHGVGLDGLRASAEVIDCGNSGTTMRLMAGLLAAQPFASDLVGDHSLSRRPMRRVLEPLLARGARITGTPHASKAGEVTPPLRVEGVAPGERLRSLNYDCPVASAQVKSAILLSGLRAGGETLFREPLKSRDHSERMLAAMGAQLVVDGCEVRLQPLERDLEPFEWEVPGDLSSAAFPLVAASLIPGSAVEVQHVLLNPTRTGLLDAIAGFQGQLRVEVRNTSLGEPSGVVYLDSGETTASVVEGELALRAIDEIPALAVLAARSRGVTEFRDVGELRVKESDRIARTVQMLRAFGVEAEEGPDWFRVEGVVDRPLRAATIDSDGDHRIAMSATVLGLVAEGETVVTGAEQILSSFPTFVPLLRQLGAQIEEASE